MYTSVSPQCKSNKELIMLVVFTQTDTNCQVTHILCIEIKRPQTTTLKRENTHDFCISMKQGKGGKVRFVLYMLLRKQLLFHFPGLEGYKGSNNGL